MKVLSVIIPAYNEEETISNLLERVLAAKISLKKEIIIINDGSTDNTKTEAKKTLDKLIKIYKNDSLLIISKKNGGKGSAVKLGFEKASGDIIIIQDADLEYNPDEYQTLINPIIDNQYKVVYGSRRLNKNNKGYSNLSFFIGGIIVTKLTNLLFNSKLTDEPTCYKVFEANLIKNIRIIGNGFEWEPEVTAKILKKKIKIHEIPISYNPRKKNEGKKINWKDGMKAIWTLFYWRFKN
ncbi:glycosyltransferase family 2 protein [Candidatus Pacearchaeota archaeon]|nr:glycosyltransferase family 2 protein [Candidatus Pacearchaeota archaeon]